MNMKSHVCSYEQSKILTELGVANQAIYMQDEDGFTYLTEEIRSLAFDQPLQPAFLLSELAVMLGAYFEVYLTDTNVWKGRELGMPFETPTEAAADRLIELIEQVEVSVKDCNDRLINGHLVKH